jgi:hypothetical protein
MTSLANRFRLFRYTGEWYWTSLSLLHVSGWLKFPRPYAVSCVRVQLTGSGTQTRAPSPKSGRALGHSNRRIFVFIWNRSSSAPVPIETLLQMRYTLLAIRG